MPKNEAQCLLPEDAKLENHVVSWMSMDDTLLFGDSSKDVDSTGDYDFVEDSEDEDNDYSADDDNNSEHNGVELDLDNLRTSVGFNEKIHNTNTEHFFGGHGDSTKPEAGKEANIDSREDTTLKLGNAAQNEREYKNHGKDKTEMIESSRPSPAVSASEKGDNQFVSGSIPMQKKSQKMAFCPKEVKNILDSEVLKLKNAQTHTMRKIIVFASLGIRHGCEDMYELDFNHFSILQKGEPYISANNPGVSYLSINCEAYL